jgi:hypothetical protein
VNRSGTTSKQLRYGSPRRERQPLPKATTHVWELERQWASTADQAAAPHFLGAIVIEDRPVLTGDVDTRLVVDGQQRLTTLQLLLRGVLDALQDADADSRLQARLRKAIVNDEDVVAHDQLLKLSPRQAERDLFEVAMDGERPKAFVSKFADARTFFAKSAAAFLSDLEVPEDPYTSGEGVDGRAALLVATLLGLVKVVVIDLEDADDAQVIFEALNARNTPLSATDLVKNLLFLRAESQQQLDAQEMYDTLWKRFDIDSGWWLEGVGVGHAQRARQDWLLGDWLIAQRGRSINVGRLYGEFRQWLDESGTEPYTALTTLNRYADAYEMLNGRRVGASPRERRAYESLDRLNITAATPVMLWLFVQDDSVLEARSRERAMLALESFVIRRMAAKYQTRAYGQVFADVLQLAQQAQVEPGQGVIRALQESPHGYAWPTDESIAEVFATGRFYGPGGINQDRLRLILGAIDRKLQQDAVKSEALEIGYNGLQIEHIIPQEWQKTWPLVGSDPVELIQAEQERAQTINRIGNLTLANQHLNPAMSNDPWIAKRIELMKHSKLQLNVRLVELDAFDESEVVVRGRWLAEEFSEVWPGPQHDRWTGVAEG